MKLLIPSIIFTFVAIGLNICITLLILNVVKLKEMTGTYWSVFHYKAEAK